MSFCERAQIADYGQNSVSVAELQTWDGGSDNGSTQLATNKVLTKKTRSYSDTRMP